MRIGRSLAATRSPATAHLTHRGHQPGQRRRTLIRCHFAKCSPCYVELRTIQQAEPANYSPGAFQFKINEMGAAACSTTVSTRKRCPPAATM